MLTQDLLNDILTYCPDTGKLTWKTRHPDMFPCLRTCNSWNSRYAGTSAGGVKKGVNCKSVTDYVELSIQSVKFKAHRIIWCMVYGEMPEHTIDHIDADGTNNRLDNLRAVTIGENLRNSRQYRNNKTGVTGVFWHKHSQKWNAQIGLGKPKFLGAFNDFDDAVAARREAEKEHGYNEKHGSLRVYGAT